MYPGVGPNDAHITTHGDGRDGSEEQVSRGKVDCDSIRVHDA